MAKTLEHEPYSALDEAAKPQMISNGLRSPDYFPHIPRPNASKMNRPVEWKAATDCNGFPVRSRCKQS